jgi:hypothetical protein
MPKAPSSEQKFVLLGPRKGLFREPPPPRVSVAWDRAEVEGLVRSAPRGVTWVSFDRDSTDLLLERAVTLRADLSGSHLLTLAPPRSESIPALLRLFHPVFGLVKGSRWLPGRELMAALMRDDASDRFIGGSADPKAGALTLIRGDLEAVVAPFSLFEPSGDGLAPDFSALGFTDYGRTVALGDYEASADAILYELDPVYRRRLHKQRRQADRSFGASLMRLRKQRRLRRSDFPPISSKEIARIERNEVAKPHAKTLDVIAHRLGVRPAEIEGY